MKTTTRLAVRRLLFGSTAANRRRLAAALIAIGLLVIPGVMLGALITERLWSQRRTPASSRWGWSVVAAATVAFVAPMVVWTWPGQLLSGGISFGSVIGSGIVEAMMAPLTVRSSHGSDNLLPQRPRRDRVHPLSGQPPRRTHHNNLLRRLPHRSFIWV